MVQAIEDMCESVQSTHASLSCIMTRCRHSRVSHSYHYIFSTLILDIVTCSVSNALTDAYLMAAEARLRASDDTGAGSAAEESPSAPGILTNDGG